MAEGRDEHYRDGDINAVYELDKSTFAQDLIDHHRKVLDHYDRYNNNREVNHNFVRGHHFDDDEDRRYRDKRKTQVVFNNIKTSERTILGILLQNRYDVKFMAQTPEDDDMSRILQQLDEWTSQQQEDDMNDIEIVRQAWAGGNSFQECSMEIVNGRDPIMHTNNQNSFAVYFDPDSRRIITREDAQFVDRVSFQSYSEMKKNFPEKESEISRQLVNRDRSDNTYDDTQKFADRDHEFRTQRNSKFRVIERFFKVDGQAHFAEVNGERIEVDKEDLKEFKADNPQVQVQTDEVEELWIAIACEDYSNDRYLYNGPYHNQPRDPRTGKIIWPILEMVAESLAGEPQGFVDHEKGPNKVINSMMSNIVSSATHASAAASLMDPTAFISEKEAKLCARHHADSDRTFQVKHGRTVDAVLPIQKAGVNQDNITALDYSTSHLREVSSTPPSLMGQEEKGSPSGILNAQRIEQGATQLQPFFKNYRLFLKQRAKLRYYYWRQYYTKEMTFRIVQPDTTEMNPFATINKMEPEQDAVGRFTGGYRVLNDLNAAIYDIHIQESIKSPSYRAKQLRYMSELGNTSFAQNDPGLGAALLNYTLELSDASPEVRKNLQKHSTLIQQAAAAEKQAEQQLSAAQTEGQQLQNMGQMQEMANIEAQQTGLPVIEPAGQPQLAGAGF